MKHIWLFFSKFSWVSIVHQLLNAQYCHLLYTRNSKLCVILHVCSAQGKVEILLMTTPLF